MPLPSSSLSKDDKVQVAVRIRPPNSSESGTGTVVHAVDTRMLVFDPVPQDDETDQSYYKGKSLSGKRGPPKKKHRDVKFGFDRVFGPEATNIDLYNHTTKNILDKVLNGFNCSVFAYGATGAGKTFSMLGSKDNPGVIFYTMMDLFKTIEAIRNERTCEVSVSYLEVYNEMVRDLLKPGPSHLPVREDPRKGVIIQGLSVHKPKTAEELLYMLEFGNKNRTQHPTDANAESSRSHAVFQVFVNQANRTAGLSNDVKVGKMSLIDLAGSERATMTKNSGARFREGANINRSLLALGNCINALAERKRSQHIPYRDSRLTRILKDSLGGNCHTVMIAAVSPSQLSYEDTYNTLTYADRAKNIKAEVKRNVLNVNAHIHQYAKIVEDLKTEISELKGKLSESESALALTSAAGPSTSSHNLAPALDISMLAKLDELFSGCRSQRKELVGIVSSQKELGLKVYRKERSLQRLLVLDVQTENFAMSCSKVQRAVGASKAQETTLAGEAEQMKPGVLAAQADMERAVKEAAAGLPANSQTALDHVVESHRLRMELDGAHQQIQHLKRCTRSQEQEAQANQRLMEMLLRAVKSQHQTLSGAGLASPAAVSQFDTIVGVVTQGRSVVFRATPLIEPQRPPGDCGEDMEGGSFAAGGSLNVFNALLEVPVYSRSDGVGKGSLSPIKKNLAKALASARSVGGKRVPGSAKKRRSTELDLFGSDSSRTPKTSKVSCVGTFSPTPYIHEDIAEESSCGGGMMGGRVWQSPPRAARKRHLDSSNKSALSISEQVIVSDPVECSSQLAATTAVDDGTHYTRLSSSGVTYITSASESQSSACGLPAEDCHSSNGSSSADVSAAPKLLPHIKSTHPSADKSGLYQPIGVTSIDVSHNSVVGGPSEFKTGEVERVPAGLSDSDGTNACNSTFILEPTEDGFGPMEVSPEEASEIAALELAESAASELLSAAVSTRVDNKPLTSGRQQSSQQLGLPQRLPSGNPAAVSLPARMARSSSFTLPSTTANTGDVAASIPVPDVSSHSTSQSSHTDGDIAHRLPNSAAAERSSSQDRQSSTVASSSASQNSRGNPLQPRRHQQHPRVADPSGSHPPPPARTPRSMKRSASTTSLSHSSMPRSASRSVLGGNVSSVLKERARERPSANGPFSKADRLFGTGPSVGAVGNERSTVAGPFSRDRATLSSSASIKDRQSLAGPFSRERALARGGSSSSLTRERSSFTGPFSKDHQKGTNGASATPGAGSLSGFGGTVTKEKPTVSALSVAAARRQAAAHSRKALFAGPPPSGSAAMQGRTSSVERPGLPTVAEIPAMLPLQTLSPNLPPPAAFAAQPAPKARAVTDGTARTSGEESIPGYMMPTTTSVKRGAQQSTGQHTNDAKRTKLV